MWLSFELEPSGHDLLPVKTPGKLHRASTTYVYCLCRPPEGIRHRCDDWTVADEEIWILRKVHNHDRDDGQRQEWRGCLGYIC